MRICLFLLLFMSSLAAQPVVPSERNSKEKKGTLKVPERIQARPSARDEEIQQRLKDILYSTGWFFKTRVQVTNGVVFLTGEAKSEEYKIWAGDLAGNIQDVTAVVNKIEVMEPSIWDFRSALEGLKRQWRNLLGSVPSMVLGIIILATAWGLAKLIALIVRKILHNKVNKSLLEEVIARAIGFMAFLLGVYVVFEMADLTTMALTILGGTGILSIILGIAFRDITENFLASILLSIQNPFRNGDLVEIEDVLGYVQRLTIRVTIIMSLEGTLIQIPNSTVYKSNLRNFSSNPNRREDFTVGIGYENVISDVQKIALKVLEEHPAVLKNPEPWVLVDNFGKAVINLKIYFWLDGSEHSWLKVRSSVIRLVKRSFQLSDISMPDEAREIIFPSGVPLIEPQNQKELLKPLPKPSGESKSVATDAESGLESEAEDIKGQSKNAHIPEEGKNFLKNKKRK